MSSPLTPPHPPPYPFAHRPRAIFSPNASTETTELQAETEDECAPYIAYPSSYVPCMEDRHVRYLASRGLIVGTRPSSSEESDATVHRPRLWHDVRLIRDVHLSYVSRALVQPPEGKAAQLGPQYVGLDASRPWIAYWTLHSLDLMGFRSDSLEPGRDTRRNIVETLRSLWDGGGCATTTDAVPGGYGGGTKQMGHAAPTYAGVLATLIVGAELETDGAGGDGGGNWAYDSIDRGALYRWIFSLRAPSPPHGTGFRMHHGGEVDVRGTYTILAIAALLNVLTPELVEGAAEYCRACQTYEGGFGGEPHNEAHGGYTFCAAAALFLLGRLGEVRTEALRGWIARRQTTFEGGFQGRPNKLVDGCYSFWVGGAAAVLNMYDSQREDGDESKTTTWDGILDEAVTEIGGGDGTEVDISGPAEVVRAHEGAGGLMYDQGILQHYILLCAQTMDGGLRDKPSKPVDFYHTCYNLSGLSLAQHTLSEGGIPVVLGDAGNALHATHPLFNIRASKAKLALDYFNRMETGHSYLMNASTSSS